MLREQAKETIVKLVERFREHQKQYLPKYYEEKELSSEEIAIIEGGTNA